MCDQRTLGGGRVGTDVGLVGDGVDATRVGGKAGGLGGLPPGVRSLAQYRQGRDVDGVCWWGRRSGLPRGRVVCPAVADGARPWSGPQPRRVGRPVLLPMWLAAEEMVNVGS